MKTPQVVVTTVERRLSERWHLAVAGVDALFPRAFSLGRPSAAELRSNYARVHALTVQWQDWAADRGLRLTYETRLAAGGTRQEVPTHLHIDSLDQAAAVVGGPWPGRLARARARRDVLTARYPTVVDPARLIRMVDSYSDLDVELLQKVADWYLGDPAMAQRMTPRQVPVPGVHAKWLQHHLPAVGELTGIDDLGLLPAHPQRIHFTYVDPVHRARGGRWHDSATVGDRFTPAYLPKVVIISENKDTAIHFPELADAISVEGVGRGGRTLASFRWIADAPLVVYWGDMDRDGYEILNGYRIDFGRDLDSILMDENAYRRYEVFGTNVDQRGKALTAGDPRSVDHLRSSEQAVYRRLLEPGHDQHRRIEQERIPLHVALDAVQALVRQSQ